MFTLTRLPKNTVLLTFEIPWSDTRDYVQRGAKKIGSEMSISGFRPGKVPAEHVITTLGSVAILEKYIEHFVAAYYSTAVTKENLAVVGNPKIQITQLVEGLPVQFTAECALLPEITVGDYTTIHVEKNVPVVEEKEVTSALEELARIKAAGNKENQTPPPLDDTFAQSLGEFKTLQDLKQRITQNLQEEKEYAEENRREEEMLDKILAMCTIGEIPDALIESQKSSIYSEMRHTIEQKGIVFAQWLEHMKKTDAEFLDGLKPLAEKKIRISLLLRAVAQKASITASDAEISTEIDALTQGGSSEERTKQQNNPELQQYVRNLVTSRKTLQFLKEKTTKQKKEASSEPAPTI